MSFGSVSKMAARVAAIAAVGLGAVTSPAFAGPVTIQQSGAVGYWYDQNQPNLCMRDSFGGAIQIVEPYVTRTPNYTNRTETIYVQSRIDYWNGSGWAAYRAGPWVNRTLAPGQKVALFSQPWYSVPRGRYYRVVQYYQWYVGSTRVGTVTNLFDANSYSAAWVSSARPSHCYVY